MSLERGSYFLYKQFSLRYNFDYLLFEDSNIANISSVKMFGRLRVCVRACKNEKFDYFEGNCIWTKAAAFFCLLIFRNLLFFVILLACIFNPIFNFYHMRIHPIQLRKKIFSVPRKLEHQALSGNFRE